VSLPVIWRQGGNEQEDNFTKSEERRGRKGRRHGSTVKWERREELREEGDSSPSTGRGWAGGP